MYRPVTVTAGALAILVVASVATVAPGPASPPSVAAAVETAPVSHAGDAADDPAVWVDPADPGRSAVIGTDKQGALAV